MTEITASVVRIRSSLQEPVDQWEIMVPGAAEYLALANDRTVDLTLGLFDALGNPVDFRALTAGVVDEHRLEVTTRGVVSYLKGRDAGAALLETIYKKLYARFPEKTVASGAITTDKVVGIFTARQVAEEMIRSVNLIPAWQTRDYELWEDFDATGRIIDLLQRLVDPWCSVEPSRTDIFLDGDTVFLRARAQTPSAADFVLHAKPSDPAPHVRGLAYNVRKRRLPLIGDLTLMGRVEAGTTDHSFDGPTNDSGTWSRGVSVIPFSSAEDPDGGLSFTPGTMQRTSTSRAFDPSSGQLQSMVVTTATYQMPNQVLVALEKDTYALVGGTLSIVKSELKTVRYQPFTYDKKGPTNSPCPTAEYNAIFRYVDDVAPDGTPITLFVQDTDETTTYSYDEDNYLVLQAVLKRVARDNEMVPDTLVVKLYRDTVPLWYDVETDRYLYQEETTQSADGLTQITTSVPRLVTSDITPASGHRPGGPNRPPSKPLQRDFGGLVSQPVFHKVTISSDAKGQDRAAGSPHMSEADLAFIRAQQEAASGVYEAELSFTALSMPWIKRGTLIQVAGLLDEQGVEIPMGIALVYSVDMTVDIPGRAATSEIRAVWWEAPPP